MSFLGQTWTLTWKNLLIVFWRHATATTFRAFVLPIVYMFFISYAKNFFVPPSTFGIGPSTPVLGFQDALGIVGTGHDKVVFVNNGFTDGDIGNVIAQVSSTVTAAGKTVLMAQNDNDVDTLCPSTLNGVTQCYGAASFYSSPNQGPGGNWNYTLRFDGALNAKIYVDRPTNDVQTYVLPFQHAIDAVIANVSGGNPLPDSIHQYPYTSESQEQRNQRITRLYQDTVINIIAVAFFIAVVGVTYQLVGQMALERELGMSQLIEAMMPNRRRWQPQAARLLSYHIAFDIIYLPSWIICGIIVKYLVFPQSNIGIVIVLHILTGLSLTSYSLLFGALFRKAQLSGITTVIISLILAIVAQIPLGKHASTGAVVILGLLFPPMTYIFFLLWAAGFQKYTIGPNLVQASPAMDWTVSGIALWVFFIIQIFVFPILSAFLERSLYGTASKARKLHHENPDDKVAVRLEGFSKYYQPHKLLRLWWQCLRRKSDRVVKAVENLSLHIYQGQIMILLGANGSGKSTTLDAIAGLNEITSGSIDIDGRGGLGLCPQKNVLWDEVTVYEHVKIFDRLKTTGRKTSKAGTIELIQACDLEIKLKAQAKTLSGGQKRKLQLAMMFSGGSQVCCIDEVSSGIDPLARRKIWDILLAERGRRTILLTTHFLDEAEVLSDQIAVLSKGVLKCEGTAVELKHHYGGGYRVEIPTSAAYHPSAELSQVQRVFDYDRTIYQLADSRQTLLFLNDLETKSIVDYRVHGPTIEDVFLKMAEEIKAQFEDTNHSSPTPDRHSKEGSAVVTIDDKSSLSSGQNAERTAKNYASALDLLPGTGTGLFRQSWILLRKRFTILKHNYFPYVVAVIIPVIAAGLVTLFLKSLNGPLGCNPGGSQLSQEDFENLENSVTADVVYGPPSLVPPEAVYVISPGLLNATSVHPVDTLDALNSFIAINYQNVTPGGLWIGDNPTFAWFADYGSPFQPIADQNIMDAYLTGINISTGTIPFATPYAPSAGNTLQLILYFGLAMCAYPGFFALYPTAERLRKVRALHYSNGIRSLPMWTAYTLFDFIFVLIVSVIAIALWVGLWDGWYAPGYLFVVFFLYGLTSVVYCYAISLFTTSQLATFAFASGSQAVLFLLYFIAYLAIITYAPVNQINHFVTVAHFTIALITPAGNLARAILLTLNEFSLLCRGHDIASYPGALLVYGGPILYLIVQFFLLLAFVVWWDGGGRPRWPRFGRRQESAPSHVDAEHDAAVEGISEPITKTKSGSAEVGEELARVQTSNDGLRVLNLIKHFGSNTAVENVTFGIRKSEVFALLGPNGAGKSTTISLIRGDLRPSSGSGEVYVEDIALSHHRAAARMHLGVCPQFDAIDTMTVREHLSFYARARGVPEINHNVNAVMSAVGLTSYVDRLASKLSGGNKRKLSLAIALMGNPSVLLLDEPSSGMDAAAKRVMWRVLAAVTPGRALLITTHSMEEADALANRAGILACRMLALGTVEHLRNQHGSGWGVHLVHREAPHTSDAEMERMKTWVREHIPDAALEERTYHGQLRFSVPAAAVARVRDPTEAGSKSAVDSETKEEIETAGQRTTLTPLIRLLEANKEAIDCAYYSVSPTTLDQVFLNVVRGHNVAEENYHEAAPRPAGREGKGQSGKERRSWWPQRSKKQLAEEQVVDLDKDASTR